MNATGATRANGSDAAADGCAISTTLTPGQRDLDWDAGIWKLVAAPPSAPPLEQRQHALEAFQAGSGQAQAAR